MFGTRRTVILPSGPTSPSTLGFVIGTDMLPPTGALIFCDGALIPASFVAAGFLPPLRARSVHGVQ